MSGGLQPFLHDQVVLVSAPTMAICPPDGQIDGTGAGGLFIADRRVLSRLRVLVDGYEPEPIHHELDSAASARFVAVLRHLAAPTPDVALVLQRRRRLVDHADAQLLSESLTFLNSGRGGASVVVTVEVGCDLADVASIKDGSPRPVATVTTSDPTGTGVTFSADEVPGWFVAVTVDPPTDAPATLVATGPTTFRFPVDVAAGATVSIDLTIAPTAPASALVVAAASRQGLSEAPTVSSRDRVLGPLLARSLDDLDRLALHDPLDRSHEFYAAGAPWYLTLFGRDSLWSAWLALPLGLDRVAGTLRVLARRQATGHDPGIAAEPGKILHEVRAAELVHEGGFGLPPVYYGSIDSTPMWIRLLHRAWRWGMPVDEVRALLPALRSAVDWLLESSDADGDGLLEYIDSSGRGLANQGWKDSVDSVQHADGTLAEAPIALCEVQGYAYAAALAAVELYEAFDVHDATHDVEAIRAWGQRLRAAFHEHFWVTDDAGTFIAIALDGQKRAVASRTSNPGHLLTSGLLEDAQIDLVARGLAEPDLSSGFGLRTMSTRSRRYNPLGYHTGSVWTHDTAIVIGELAAAGRSDEAWTLVQGLLRASPVFDHRFPELFAGESAADVTAPSPYPASCRPQAWAAAAAPALLTALLGLAPDVPAGTLTLSPCGLSEGRLDGLEVRGLVVAGGRLSVRISGTSVDVVEAPPGLRIILAR